MTIDKEVMKVLNNISQYTRVPADLRRYILIRYSEAPSIFHDYTGDELYINIRNDIASYENGTQDVDIEPKTPDQKTKEDWDELSDAFGHVLEENERLSRELCELKCFIAEHNLNKQLEMYHKLWSDSLEPSDVLPFN